MAEVNGGLSILAQAAEITPPSELITRIAYLAPSSRAREPFEREGLSRRLANKWFLPILQPRLAMGMAMTILSFSMLVRCNSVQVQHIQAADLNPVRVWGGVENKALRAKDQVLKYYDNLRVVYEIETHLKDLQDQGEVSDRPARGGTNGQPANKPPANAQPQDRSNYQKGSSSHSSDQGTK